MTKVLDYVEIKVKVEYGDTFEVRDTFDGLIHVQCTRLQSLQLFRIPQKAFNFLVL